MKILFCKTIKILKYHKINKSNKIHLKIKKKKKNDFDIYIN